MRILVNNLYCRVAGATDADLDWLDGFLTFETTATEMARRAADKLERIKGAGDDAFAGPPPDGKLHLLNRRWNTFATGFLRPVAREAAAAGVRFDVDDRRPPLPRPDLGADLGWLRDYQRDMAMRMLRRQRGVVKAPTGSGKTESIIALAKLLPTARFGVLVHRKELARQAAERFALRGVEAGVIGDGEWSPGRVTCATFQTLARGLAKKGGAPGRADAFLEDLDAVVVDEVHVLPAGSFWRVTMRAKKARFRWGVSATPLDRSDRRDVLVIASLGPLIHEVQVAGLIDRGLLSRPRIRLVPCFQRLGLGRDATWRDVYRAGVAESAARNAVVVACTRLAAKPALVFVKEVAHGHALRASLGRAGLRADFVWGDDSTDARRDAAARLVRGELDALVVSVIWQEGVDIPEVASIVVAAGGRSVIAALQRLGRGMRVAAGKDEIELWDVRDRGPKWLARHADEREAAYRREGYDVEVLDAPAQERLDTAQRSA